MLLKAPQFRNSSSSDSSNGGVKVGDPSQRSKTIKLNNKPVIDMLQHIQKSDKLFVQNENKKNIRHKSSRDKQQNLENIMDMCDQNSQSSFRSRSNQSQLGQEKKSSSLEQPKNFLDVKEEKKQSKSPDELKSDRGSHFSKKSKRHQQFIRNKIKKNFESSSFNQNNNDQQEADIIPAIHAPEEDCPIPDENSHNFSAQLCLYERNFRKQEIFSFLNRRGFPVPNEMRPLAFSQEHWALPSIQDPVLQKHAFLQRQQEKSMSQQQKSMHQQRVFGLLQDVEKNIDSIQLHREKFLEDYTNEARLGQEEKMYLKHEDEIQKVLKRRSLKMEIEIKKQEEKPIPKIEEEKFSSKKRQTGGVSDSDVSFYDSDNPDFSQKKRSIIQPSVSNQISIKVANKQEFLHKNQMVIQEDEDEEEEEVQIPDRLANIEEIQHLIKKVSARIPQLKSENPCQAFIKLTEQLFERNVQLESEKSRLMDDIKKKVQNSGHLVHKKFNSFGQKNEDCDSGGLMNSRDQIQEQVIKLAQIIEDREISSTLNEIVQSLNTFNSARLPSMENSCEKPVKKSFSVDPVSQQNDSNKQEQLKALKETLENTKLNNDLLAYLQENLSKLQIDFNQGFIISLSIQEKLELKEMILKIDQKNIEQKKNDEKIQEGGEEAEHDLIKRFSSKEPSMVGSLVSSRLFQNPSEYQAYSDSQQISFFKKAFDDQKYKEGDPVNDEEYLLLKEALKTDYSFHFQMKNGIFIAQTQVQYSQLIALKRSVAMIEEFKKQSNFETLSKRMRQEKQYKDKPTLVIDIENVLLDKIDLDDEEDVEILISSMNFEKNFIIVKKSVEHPFKCTIEGCGKKQIMGYCQCNIDVYNIRPYSFEIIGALMPFYELIVCSLMTISEVLQIVDHFEKILNLPLEDKNRRTIQKIEAMVMRGKQVDQRDRIGRFKPNILKKQMYFQFMMCNNNFQFFEEINDSLENLHTLTKNREAHKIFLLTSHQTRLVAAMDQGFCGIPVLRYQKFDDSDFQLRLIENYIIKNQYFIDYKSKNINDFGILTQRCPMTKNVPLIDQNAQKSFEFLSQDSCFRKRENP